jgi:hypothetical protein
VRDRDAEATMKVRRNGRQAAEPEMLVEV